MNTSNLSQNIEVVESNSPEETQAIAKKIMQQARANTTFALYGELGSGKTCFVQGIAEALAIKTIITSPTFIIINQHNGLLPLFHIDLYRIKKKEEIYNIGLDEYFYAGGITAIEWPEKAEDLLPKRTFKIYFNYTSYENKRIIKIIKPKEEN